MVLLGSVNSCLILLWVFIGLNLLFFEHWLLFWLLILVLLPKFNSFYINLIFSRPTLTSNSTGFYLSVKKFYFSLFVSQLPSWFSIFWSRPDGLSFKEGLIQKIILANLKNNVRYKFSKNNLKILRRPNKLKDS